MRKLVVMMTMAVWATSASASVVATDPGADVGIPILDLTKLEAAVVGTDVVFTVTVNGDIGATNWGKYLLSIDTDLVPGSGGMSQFPDADPPTNDANPWVRNIAITNNDHLAEYFIGSWVDSGGGIQLWEFTGTGSPQWSLVGTPSITLNPGAVSTVEFTIPMADIGVGLGDTISMEAYSSGGGSFDTANDTVNNPSDDWVWDGSNWQQQATVQNSSLWTVPEPATLTLLGLGALALLRRRS